MIQYTTGNLLESQAQALVNTVNTVGIMGKGIALQFKNKYPDNFKTYAKACKENVFTVGQLLITETEDLLLGKKIIINFPTKTDWRKPSQYQYIESGLQELVKIIQEKNIQSIAIPPLGAGNGGLLWSEVKLIIEKYLSDMDCLILVYEPNFVVEETFKKERVNLTPARAMLLAVLYELVRNGESVSEFACEKICYFLQRFGAKKLFNLDYNPHYYGPYSGKVRHVLHYLNGTYIRGFSKDKKPFDELDLLMNHETEVLTFLETPSNLVNKEIVAKTKLFLDGFYSSFSLELLSSIDYIAIERQTYDKELIKNYLDNWSQRKKTLSSNSTFLEKGIEKIKTIQV